MVWGLVQLWSMRWSGTTGRISGRRRIRPAPPSAAPLLQTIPAVVVLELVSRWPSQGPG